MSRPAEWSVSAQLRLLVVTMLCIVPVVAGAALLTVHDNSRDTARGSQALSPALDATAAVRQEMADANARWSRELVSPPTGADSQLQASLAVHREPGRQTAGRPGS